MKNAMKFLVVLLAVVSTAYAQDDISISTGIIGNGKYLGAKTTDGQTTVGVLGVDANGKTAINGLGGVILQANKTPGAQIAYPSTNVITPAVTAAAYTPNTGYTMSSRFNSVATAAPTLVAVQLPVATSYLGQTFEFYNEGASPALIIPVLGNSINALAAGTPLSCATTKSCECTARYNTRFVCVAK